MIVISLNTLPCSGWENKKRLGEYENVTPYHEIVTKWQQLKIQNNF